MRTSIRRGLLVTALAGTCVIAVMPAALAQATQSPEAFALDATGPVALGPVADAHGPTFPDTASAAGVTLNLLLNVGSASDSALTSTVTEPSSSVNTATSTVDSVSSILSLPTLLPLNLTPQPLIAGSAITSTCDYNSADTPAYTETVSIGSLSVLGDSINVTGPIGPNTTLAALPTATGLTLSVTLNQQVPGPDGSETVNAIAISVGTSLIGTGTENIFLASSTCGPESTSVASPVASGKGLGLGLGLLGLIGAGLGAVYVRRRSSLQAA